MIHIPTQLYVFIAQKLALDDLTDAEQRELADQTIDVLSKRVFVDLLPHLKEDDRSVIAQMMNNTDVSDVDMDVFLRDIMAQYVGIIKNSADAFFEELSEVIKN